MAKLNTRMNIKNSSGTYDIHHIETNEDIVLCDSGTKTLKQKLNEKNQSIAQMELDISNIPNQIHQQVGIQIEDNTNSLIKKSNSKGYLELPVYNGDSNQATHPSVLFFDSKFGGYHYWLAMTPYEKENENLENPSILASDDGVTWIVPTGLTNPISATTNVSNYHYSDTHLVFANNKLECWYRKRTRGALPTNEIIIRKTSTNGVNWSSEEILYQTNIQRADVALSPVVIFEENKYKIWLSNMQNNVLDYFETATGTNWVKIRSIAPPIHSKNLKVWHMDIKHTTNGYEMYYCAGLDYNCYEICYSVSTDNITFSKAITVMKPSVIGFDENRLYRPCFVDSWLNKRYIYYGAIKTNNDWFIGLTLSDLKSPTVLEGANLSANSEFTGDNNYTIPNTLVALKHIIIKKLGYIKEDAIKIVKRGIGGVILKVSDTELDTLQVLNDYGDGYSSLMTKDITLYDNTRKASRKIMCDNDFLKFFDGNYFQNVSLIIAGNTNERPLKKSIGSCYFDTNLNKPIWWNGTVWKDSNGTNV